MIVVAQWSPKRERKSLHAWTQEFDLEISIGDRCWLPDQLIRALL